MEKATVSGVLVRHWLGIIDLMTRGAGYGHQVRNAVRCGAAIDTGLHARSAMCRSVLPAQVVDLAPRSPDARVEYAVRLRLAAWAKPLTS